MGEGYTIENLKCCGNCLWLLSCGRSRILSCGICREWKYDGYLRKERLDT